MDVNATAAPLVRPGKLVQSVGHLAKAAVAEARANGIDVPKNAQGVAASAIAHGADPASIFAAQVVADPVVPDAPAADVERPADTPETADPADAMVEGEGAEAATAAAAASYSAAQVVVGDSQLTGEETALQLLQG